MLTKATHPQKMKGDLGIKQNDWELSFLFFFFKFISMDFKKIFKCAVEWPLKVTINTK